MARTVGIPRAKVEQRRADIDAWPLVAERAGVTIRANRLTVVDGGDLVVDAEVTDVAVSGRTYTVTTTTGEVYRITKPRGCGCHA